VNTYGDASRRDEEASAPIYNYARFLPWVESVEMVAAVFEEAAEKTAQIRPVGRSPSPWVQVASGTNMVELEIRRSSKEPVHGYFCLDESLAKPRQRGLDEAFASRFFVASTLALSLQWGTIGGAIVVAVCLCNDICDLTNIR
jgi:hypothetical protein